MTTRPPFDALLKAIDENLDSVDPKQVEGFTAALMTAYHDRRTIGVVGAGRSGLVAKAFAMRLMHLGFNVFVIGETITPAIGKDDVLFAVSGSGDTALTVSSAQVARHVGAKVISITSFPGSSLAGLSDILLIVPGRIRRAETDDYFSRQLLGIHEPLAPLGTLFELSTSILMDSIVVELMKALKINEKDMQNRHSTIH
ncbi:MAG TPA: 6-phospho-3-hexuloisomerase [Thermoproteota archaeon]|nr:6-phospho-3-hexuloisomerase [Thermoproteota archaeon]